MKASILILFFIFTGCGQSNKSELANFERTEKDYHALINSSNVSSNPLQTNLYLANDNYPIELSLHKNGKFYYNLANLGDGQGRWWYKKGKIQLFAKRDLFDMEMQVIKSEPNAQEFVIEFRDRFGAKQLKLEIVDKRVRAN